MAHTTAPEYVFPWVNMGENLKQRPIRPRGINPPLAVVAKAVQLRVMFHIEVDIIIRHFGGARSRR